MDELEVRWADAWRPEQVAERLDGVGAPWCVAAGWALDLFRGKQSRPHGDLEIAVPAAGFPEIRHRFPECVFDAVGSGRVWPGSGAEALAATHQTWLRDPASGQFLFDVFREPHEGGTWICRRDERLRLPYDAIIERTADGAAPHQGKLRTATASLCDRQAQRNDRQGSLLSLLRHRSDPFGQQAYEADEADLMPSQ